MDGLMDERTGSLADGWMGGQSGRWMEGQVDERTDGRYGWMHAYTEGGHFLPLSLKGSSDQSIDRQADGRMNRQMDG